MSTTRKPIITVGQALLILIDKHQHDSDKTFLNELKRLYFLGAKDQHARIKELLKDKTLKEFEISKDWTDINEDPTRRYFETQLAHCTLHPDLEHKKTSPVDNLSLIDLQKHYSTLIEMLVVESKDPSIPKLIEEIFNGNITNFKITFLHNDAKEYYDAVKRLEVQKTATKFSEENFDKLILIFKSAFLCNLLCLAIPETNNRLPINIYTEGFYNPVARGRILKDMKEQASTVSAHFGLMKSYMPVPPTDIATSTTVFPYLRVADRHVFDPKSEWPKDNFAYLTQPFSCSISGSMLLNLRVFADLAIKGKLVFNTKSKLADWIKTFVSLLLFNSGGHTFHEFMYPLRLPKVQAAFNFIDGFAELTNENLFLKDNEPAFEKALSAAILYNKDIIRKKALKIEIEDKSAEREIRLAIFNDELFINHWENPPQYSPSMFKDKSKEKDEKKQQCFRKTLPR